MNRRQFLGTALGGVARGLGAPRRPLNVLFVVSDDLSPTTLGCYGHGLVKSPNVDRLAAEGTRFDRAYCQYALCAPSRASFLTGLRPDTTKVLANGPDFRDFLPNVVTLPQLFKNNGYRSIREGKMFHMGVPGTVGTDRWQDAVSWHVNGSPQGKENLSKGEGKNLTPGMGAGVAMHYIATADESEQTDFDAANRAIAHIEKHRDEPFFLGLGFVRPHVPLVAPSRFFDLYPLEQVKPFVNPAGDLDDIPPAAVRMIGGRAHHMGMNEDEQREALRAYYASISFMDEQLGRVLRTLDRLKLREQTVIVFQSDHGWHLGEHTYWQKRSLMEESARVPLIIAAPGRKSRGRASRALVELVDVYPTVAELCGLKAPAELEGQSLVPLLDDPGNSHKLVARTQYDDEKVKGRAIRSEHFRYIRWTGDGGGEEFYDHRRDPHEFTNVAGNARYRAALERHRKLCG